MSELHDVDRLTAMQRHAQQLCREHDLVWHSFTTYTAVPVNEPGTLSLVGTGLLGLFGLWFITRKRRDGSADFAVA